jgi:hypothetical protein
MSRRAGVSRNACILLQNIERTPEKKYKLKYAEKLLHYLWDNRIVIRKDGYLCDVIHTKSLMLKDQYTALGVVPPKILKKTMII